MTETAIEAPASSDPLSAALEAPAVTEVTTTEAAPTEAATTDKPAAEADKATEAKAAPTEYTDFNLPANSPVDADTMTAFKDAALASGLSQEQAQQMIDLGAKNAERLTQAAWAAHNAKIAGWEAQSKADKEFGGDKLNENLALASKAMAAFATPELTQVLNETGIGNHPEVIRAFVRIGKQIAGDRLVPGGTMPSGGSQSIAEKLYPSS